MAAESAVGLGPRSTRALMAGLTEYCFHLRWRRIQLARAEDFATTLGARLHQTAPLPS